MLVSMTLTFMQGHSGSAQEKFSAELSRQLSEQQALTKLATTVGHFFQDLDFENVIWLDQLVFLSRRRK